MVNRKIFIFLILVFSLFMTSIRTVSANGAADLLIHQVESFVNDDGESYTVMITVSAISDRNTPLTGLSTRDFLVEENGSTVEIDEVILIDDTPISVLVLMDMGATMQGERFRLTNLAVSNLIKDLFRGDRVAVYGFNEGFYEIVALTDNLNQARDNFENARLSASGGACLFDAIYNVLERAKNQPMDRQAIVVLSSRKDTITGVNVCSQATVDQILELSRDINHHLPVYTIGIGVDTDEANLRRIAEGTNGIYTSSTSNYDISSLFTAISNRFVSEYRIIYNSTNLPGVQTLTVKLDNQSKSMDHEFPGLPPVVTIAFPSSPDDFEAGPTRLVLSLVERGVSVDSLAFKINNVAIGVGGQVEQPPYEFEIDFSQYDGQQVELSIVAMDKDGKTLSVSTALLNFGDELIVDEGQDEDTVIVSPTRSSAQQDEVADCPEGLVCLGELHLSVLQLAIIGSAVVFLFLIILIVIKLVKKKTSSTKKDDRKVSLFDEATVDGFMLPNMQMGQLTILSSDDPMMVGKEFQLLKSPTTIGRSINCDIALPKDSAVSRKHVEIISDNDTVKLTESFKTLSDGTKQSPTYGTYVNDRKVSGDIPLHSGDEISLGRRTKLRYEGPIKPGGSADSEDVTVDQIQLPDVAPLDDATRDG